MQIFSKLQRNSINYFFIVLLLFIAIILNSSTIYFPLLLGFVFLCLDLMSAVVYLAIFTILHKYNIFYFEIFYLFYYFYLKSKILDLFDKEYSDIVIIFLIYLIYFIYLILFEKINFTFIYILYNFAFDIIMVRIFKCK